MPLVPAHDLLVSARSRGYAVGAFNCHHLDMIRAVVSAAVAESAPVILQFTRGTLDFVGWDQAAAVARQIAREAPVPVAVHLDHGDSYRSALRALRAGFTSVMVDGSELPEAENTELTRKVVEAAHAVGISVEAEIGHVGGAEDGAGGAGGLYTDPAVAERFAAATGCDSLAVAIGTAHGRYREEPRLDLDRLAAIAARVPQPLVLHGGSGVPAGQVRAAISLGIAKVNVATELKEAWAAALRRVLAEKPDEEDPRRVLTPALRAVEAVVREKIRLFGSSGRAAWY